MEKINNIRFTDKLTAPVFNNFTPLERDYILKLAQIVVFTNGEILIHEGAISKDIYVILEGTVKVTKKGESDDTILSLATLDAGSVIGEISVITNQPRSATVTAAIKTIALILNTEVIKEDQQAQGIYEKLMRNLALELSQKLMYYENKLVKYDAKDFIERMPAVDRFAVVPSSILLLFGWRWLDIMHEAPFLAEHGYDAIKIFPPQEFAVRPGNPWWTMYQPVSYRLSTFYGQEGDFIKMVDFCHSYGLKVYVDLVLNHMAAFNSNTKNIGTNGTSFSKYQYGPLNSDNDCYGYDDFYHFTSKDNKQIEDQDYSSLEGVWHLEHYDLLQMPKLKLDNPHVINVLRKYVQYLLALGVDGFRIDAAKHMETQAIKKIFEGLRTRDGLKPFLYQEYYASVPMGMDMYSFMEKYFKIGYVTSFKYGEFLAETFQHTNNNLQKLVEYSFGSSWIHYPENRAVVVIDNHDTERMMPNMLNYKCIHNNSYVLAYVFMLSWPFGVPKIMSSFRFVTQDDPLPSTTVWQDGRFTGFDANSPWVVQHRWNAIANMVLFHKRTQQAQGIAHVWASGNQLAFARVYQKPHECVAAIGFVVINSTAAPLKKRFDTGLPGSKYYNLIVSQLKNGKMQGETILVENYGMAEIIVAPFDAVVLHVDFIE